MSCVRRSSPLTFVCIICYSVHSYYSILRLLLYYYTWATSQHKYYDFLLWHYNEICKLFLLLKHHQSIYGILFYSVFYFAQLISKKKHSLLQSKSKRQLGYFVGYSCPSVKQPQRHTSQSKTSVLVYLFCTETFE